jgi:hypothetical protein
MFGRGLPVGSAAVTTAGYDCNNWSVVPTAAFPSTDCFQKNHPRGGKSRPKKAARPRNFSLHLFRKTKGGTRPRPKAAISAPPKFLKQ